MTKEELDIHPRDVETEDIFSVIQLMQLAHRERALPSGPLYCRAVHSRKG